MNFLKPSHLFRQATYDHWLGQFGPVEGFVIGRLRGVLCLSILFVLFTSASLPDKCLIDVRKVFDKMNAFAAENKVCYINYSVNSTLSQKDENGKNIVSNSSIELINSTNKRRMFSKEMNILSDEKETFTILFQQKTIYWSDAVLRDKKENIYDKLKMFQDTIFKYTERVECKSVSNQSYNKTVSIYLNDKMSKLMGMKNAVYYINDETDMLTKVTVDYLPGNKLEQVTYIFKEQNFDYKAADMSTPVRNLVFDGNMKLNKQYAGFHLIDTRKK